MFYNRCFDMNQNQDMTNIPGSPNKESKVDDNKCCNLDGVMCPPVMECPQERCCNRVINHCIEHIVPINTRIINHHVYHHVYKPVYTCCEENICENRDNNCCF
jgi:hypothetical protein